MNWRQIELTDQEIYEIRALRDAGVGPSPLSRLYGISRSRCVYVLSGPNWIWLKAAPAWQLMGWSRFIDRAKADPRVALEWMQLMIFVALRLTTKKGQDDPKKRELFYLCYSVCKEIC